MSRAYVLVLAAAALCYAALGAVLRILPSHVGDDLGGSAAAVGFAVGAPALTAIVARPAGGRVADRLGPRPLILGGAALMAAGTVPALTGGLEALDASRLLVGAGEGAIMSAAVLWLLRLAGPGHRGRALGHIGLANYAGLVAEGLGLVALAIAHGSAAVLAATIVLAAGQALAVPALGVLALRRVPAGRQGTAAGLFFSWFDAGVGLGGPVVGGIARALSPQAALAAAGAAVLAVWPVVVPRWRGSPSTATLPPSANSRSRPEARFPRHIRGGTGGVRER
ncbi:MAG TPA: MFS transporter [Baekduia sp.]|nr:MFS transporter [Baekduia sp.]